MSWQCKCGGVVTQRQRLNNEKSRYCTYCGRYEVVKDKPIERDKPIKKYNG